MTPDLPRRRPARVSPFACAVAVLIAGLALPACRSRTQPRPAAIPAAALSQTEVARIQPEMLQPPARRFTLGPGDVIEIEIIGEAGSRARTTVGPDGKIYYYLLSGLRVEGLTLAETKERLDQELTTYLRGQPQVALTLREVASKRVWLLGRFGSPGVYPLATPTTLLEAIALAGGPATPTIIPASLLTGSGAGAAVASAFRGGGPENADLRRSFVMRNGRILPVDFERLLRDGDQSQNIYLEADDFVYLPSSAVNDVYVLGSVVSPQPVSASTGVTLIGAIAGAGGPIRDAALGRVAVVRGSLTAPKMAVIDVNGILRGDDPDIRLETGDIVYVPDAGFRTASRYIDLVINTFVRTIGANEGARAVNGSTAGVELSVPITD